MKYLLIMILLLPAVVHANNHITAFGGLFAYSDNDTTKDYSGISPNGYYGVKYTHRFDSTVSVATGLKHESSVGYKEEGKGFNGVFLEMEMKLF